MSIDLIRLAVTVSLVLLAAIGLRLWRQHRSPPTAWLTGMFSTLASARVLSELLPDETRGLMAALAVAVPVCIVAFPYLLFRFTDSLEPVPVRWRRAVSSLVCLMLLATLATSIAATTGPEPPWRDGFSLAVIGFWTALSGWVVWRLWSAGPRQPAVAEQRTRTMAVAAGLLNLALLLVGIGDAQLLAGAGQVTAFASAVTFVVAFHPPRLLRTLWRRADERALWEAERDLVGSSSRDAVISGILPHVNRLLGGEGTLFVHRTGEEFTEGLQGSRLDDVRCRMSTVSGEPGETALVGSVAVTTLSQGRLGVATSAYMPLFGDDELELMARISSLLELALSRANLYERERTARASADEARSRAEQASKELEALVYGISHDLRAPIASVRGYLDCLAEDCADDLDEDGRHFLDRLRTNTEYMEQLISDLLKLSRAGRTSDEPRAVDLGDLARQIADELSVAHPEARFHIGALPIVQLGSARARQLLTNLLTNAVTHSGRSDVSVRIEPVACETPERACIRIADNGRGIPAAYRERIFGIFETLGTGSGRQRSGTGIGLAISQRIVEEAGGRIWIADEADGADVRIQLPRPSRKESSVNGSSG